MSAWVDGFFADRVADPETALEDCKEAHRYATAERDAAEPGSIREYEWQRERIRLANIAHALKHPQEKRY